VLAAGLAVALAGCGSDAPDAATSTTATAADSTATATDSTASAADSTAAGSDLPALEGSVLSFTAGRVGGGTVDVSAYVGTPVAFWFWAPG
jgi:ABC-type Fe3+-hydroxamate transport system substrate-binding protein